VFFISRISRILNLLARFSLLEFSAMARLARLVLLFLFILVYSAGSIIAKAPSSLAPFAIKAIIDDYFAKYFRGIDVINFGIKKGRAEQTIEKILVLGKQSISIKIIRKAGEKSETNRTRISFNFAVRLTRKL
jgi:hypothetical protein